MCFPSQETNIILDKAGTGKPQRHHPHAVLPAWEQRGRLGLSWDGMGWAAGPCPGQTGAAATRTAWLYQAKEKGAQVLTMVLPFKLVFYHFFSFLGMKWKPY